ncbi:hypothetical protein Vretifemale_9028 [Volvox reticuliferus]|nr:hypothetical protein Vretifemale_9028 [Volvox reticuliferus]
MELMPDGNMFDQVLAATRGANSPSRGPQPKPPLKVAAASGGFFSRPGRGASAPSNNTSVGSYTDAQGILWLIDVADAMTYLHSRQPLLVHRDLKLENILLRKDADGRLRAKLSDFGLTVAVDAAGCKVPPPQVLRAPGQSLADVRASAPCAKTTRSGAPTDQPRSPGHATVGVSGSQGLVDKGANQTGPPANGAICARAVASSSNLQKPCDPQQWHRHFQTGRKVLSHSQLPVREETGPNGVVQGPSANAGTAGPQPAPDMFHDGAQGPSPGKGKVGCGPAGIRPWSAVQPQLQPPVPSEQATSGVGAGAGTATTAALPPQEAMLRREHISISWTGMQKQATEGSSGDGSECPGGLPTRVGPHGLQPLASHGALLSQGQHKAPACPPPFASVRAASSRRSETGHVQVKMGQVNALMQLGMGHKDFLPDMYQMTFKLTSQCGSVCYMAPEVARQLPYNQKADVFSFGCIIFEVLTRQLLSDGIPEGNVDAAVEYLTRVSWSGWRPDLPVHLPKELRLLISLCWHREPRLRPSFPTIATRLREVLLDLAMPNPHTKSSLVAVPTRESKYANQQQQQQIAQQQSELRLKLLQQQQQLKKAQQQKALQLTKLQQQLQQLLSVPGPPNQTSRQQAGGVDMQSHMKQMGPDVLRTFQAADLLNGDRLKATSGVAGAAQMGSATATAAVAQIQLEAQRQQQLQLQFQQLNAVTRAACTNSAVIAARGSSGGPSAFTGAFTTPSTYAGYSVCRPSQVEKSCTAMVYTNARGAHIPGPAGCGGSHLQETAVAVLQPGRATTHTPTTSTGQQISDGSPYSLPSSVSPSSSRGGTRRSVGGPGHSPGLGFGPGQGHERGSRGNMSPSDGSGGVVSVGSSFRRSQQQQPQLELMRAAEGKDGCAWSCVVM